MTVGQLKEILNGKPDDLRVGISIETPGGYICPDGCLIEVNRVTGELIGIVTILSSFLNIVLS